MRQRLTWLVVGAVLAFGVLEGHFTYRALVKKWSRPPLLAQGDQAEKKNGSFDPAALRDAEGEAREAVPGVDLGDWAHV